MGGVFEMLTYFVELLKYTKLIEPHLNERRLLSDLGMSKEQIEKVMGVYNNANIRVQEF
jgi:hypothetical protein